MDDQSVEILSQFHLGELDTESDQKPNLSHLPTDVMISHTIDTLCHALDTEHSRLKALARSRVQIEAELLESRRKIIQLQGETDLAKSQTHFYESQAHSAQQSKSALEKSMQAALTRYQTLEWELNQTRKKYEDSCLIKNRLVRYQKRVQKYIKPALENLKNNQQILKNEIESLKADQSFNLSEIKDLKRQVILGDVKNKSLHQQNRVELGKIVESYENQILSLREKVQDFDNTKKQNNEMTSLLGELENRLIETERKYQNTLEKAEQQSRDYQNQILRLRNEIKRI